MFGTRHLNFAETIHIIQHLPNDLFFFSSRLFDSRMSSSNDCFTGESPGIGRDGSHLYTGGPRMCIGEGQVQAGLLGGGVGTLARISLMEKVVPSRLWQPEGSWSRRDAANACMAACVTGGGSRRWIVLHRPEHPPRNLQSQSWICQRPLHRESPCLCSHVLPPTVGSSPPIVAAHPARMLFLSGVQR